VKVKGGRKRKKIVIEEKLLSFIDPGKDYHLMLMKKLAGGVAHW
jgi:hypothetical protein